MEINLPLSYPPITSYPRNANIISILFNHTSYNNWLYSNHIQLHISKEKEIEYYWLMFYQPLARNHYPLIDRQYLEKDLITDNGLDIIQLIKNQLDRGRYVYLCIDTYHIPAYISQFQKSHYYHDLFIYGYNSVRNELHCADFFHNGKYSFEKISLHDFKIAYESAFKAENNNIFDIQFLKVNNNDSFSFDLNFIIESLKDYLNSYNTSKKFKMICEPLNDNEFIFGLDFYSVLINGFTRIYDEKKDDEWAITALHVLYDHKKLMADRIDYLINLGFIKQEQTQLCEEVNSLINLTDITKKLFIKYKITNECNIIERIIKNLYFIKKSDEVFVDKLIRNLEMNMHVTAAQKNHNSPSVSFD